ncbi:hypothetical protein [Paenibacillus tyrfis]|nr:hypothetical protein [Paenibacillus tyrfis]
MPAFWPLREVENKRPFASEDHSRYNGADNAATMRAVRSIVRMEDGS